MRSWQVQDAKARFSEMLETCMTEGPQVVTKRGVDAAVLVPFAEWERLKRSARPSLKDLLLADTPRYDFELPDRRSWRFRGPPELE